MSKSMRVSVEVDVHSVTCPGVWFPCKSPVYLSICFLGFHVKTKPFPAAFPLLFGDKFVFEKTFPGTTTLQHLQATLEGHPLYVELLQEVSPGHSPGAQTVLATFETSAAEFLFPYPQLRPTYTSGVDVDLLMEPTRDFPGIISPKLEASTRTHINETRQAHLDQLHDNALTLNGIPPMDKHPHIPPCNTRPHSRLEDRDPFVWRKPDETLLDRTPQAHMMNHPPVPGHGPPGPAPHSRPPTPPGHMYHTPEMPLPRPRSRSLPRSPGGHRSRSRSRGAGQHAPAGHPGHHAVPPPVMRDYHPVNPPAPPPPIHSAPPTPHGPPPVVHPHSPHTPPEHVPLNPHPLPASRHSHSHWPVPPSSDCHCLTGRYPPPPPYYPAYPPTSYHHGGCVDQITSCMASCHIDGGHPHFPHLPASQPHLHSKAHYPPPPPHCNGPCCQQHHC